jgi:hypothetical protein
MTKAIPSMSAARQAKRAAHFKLRLGLATKEIAALRRELRDVARDRYVEGSAVATADAFAALGDEILQMWLSQRMMARRGIKCPPYHLPPHVEAMVRAEISAHLTKCGITSIDVKDIPL